MNLQKMVNLTKENNKMSTRAQIKYKNSQDNIYIYKHSDGYPEGEHGVLKFLVPFVEKFFKSRGDDESYFLAQFLRHHAVYTYKEQLADYEKYKDSDNEIVRRCNRHPDEDDSPYKYLSYGLDCIQHGDIRYLYEIDNDGSIYINGKKKTKAQLNKLIKGDKL